MLLGAFGNALRAPSVAQEVEPAPWGVAIRGLLERLRFGTGWV